MHGSRFIEVIEEALKPKNHHLRNDDWLSAQKKHAADSYALSHSREKIPSTAKKQS